MKTSHQLIAGTLLLNSMLCADVTTLLPYAASLNFDSSTSVSTKDKGTIAGLYFSHGNLDYLLELDYAKTDISYKDSSANNLKQDDITVAYSRYFEKFFLKVGWHHVNTTDNDMGNGNTLIATLGGYNWVGYNKYSYTIETYYTQYKDGFNDVGIEKEVSLFQASPSITFSQAINIDTRNNIHVKLNFQKTNDYSKDNYFSYEVQDTLYYKKFFVNAKFIGGEMISGIRDGGNTVFNTKDVIKNSYGVKIGYYFNTNNVLTLGYDVNNYREYLATEDGSYDVMLLTYSYSF